MGKSRFMKTNQVKKYVYFHQKGIKRKSLILMLFVFVSLTLAAYFSLLNLKSVEAVQWWPDGGNSWKMRKQLTVTNNSAANLSSGTTVAITMDTSALVSAGKLQSDCDDLRILYQPSSTTTTEVTRHLIFPSGTTCSTSTTTKVYFKLQAALNTTISTTDYYSYYNNSGASTPSSTDNAFDIGSADATLVCPFDGSTTCAAGEIPSTESGAVRYSGSKSAMSFDGNSDQISFAGISGLSAITAEGWFYLKGYNTFPALIGQIGSGGGMYISGSSINARLPLSGGTTNTISASVSSYLNTWAHIALTYDGTNVRLFINGGLIGTVSGSGTITDTTWYISA